MSAPFVPAELPAPHYGFYHLRIEELEMKYLMNVRLGEKDVAVLLLDVRDPSARVIAEIAWRDGTIARMLATCPPGEAPVAILPMRRRLAEAVLEELTGVGPDSLATPPGHFPVVVLSEKRLFVVGHPVPQE